MKGHHQRWLSIARLALCAYGAAFLLLFWEDHGPGGKPVAQADNIQCQRNWLLLAPAGAAARSSPTTTAPSTTSPATRPC